MLQSFPKKLIKETMKLFFIELFSMTPALMAAAAWTLLGYLIQPITVFLTYCWEVYLGFPGDIQQFALTIDLFLVLDDGFLKLCEYFFSSSS